MTDFLLSKRASNIKLADLELNQAKRTATSLFKIIQFLFFRVPTDKRVNYYNRLRGKLMRLSPGDIGMKKSPPSASIGGSIAIAKNLLSGLNPGFIKLVLVELTHILSNAGLQNIKY